MKEYYKSVQEKLPYLDIVYDYLLDDNEDNEDNEDNKELFLDQKSFDKKLIDKKINKLSNYKEKDNLYFDSYYANMLNYYSKNSEEYKNMSLEKFKLIQHYNENAIQFTIGNDFFVDFTIYKIKNNTYWK